MKFSVSTISLVAASFLPLISAHLQMLNPGTFIGLDNLPPLAADGSNFPCTDLGDGGAGETYQPGSTQSIRLAGTAVHSGGSCQISFTYDSPPTRNSVWKVVKSFHGGCPVNINGNLPEVGPDPTANKLNPLDFVVPSDLPSGNAVLAWTWFNKSGNREMYMRCAKVTIAGSNSDRTAFNSLPDMFVANIGNGCSVPEGVDIAFPNPGRTVQGSASGSPSGNCGPTSSSPAPPPPQQAPPTQAPPTQAPPPPPPSNNGGSCGADGSIVCTSSSTFAICVGGTPINMGSVAAGTTCTNGQIAKRSIRFSAEHMKRAIASLF